MGNRLENTDSLFFLARRKALGDDALLGSYTTNGVEVRDVILPLGTGLLNICTGNDGSLGVSVVRQGNVWFKYGVWMVDCGGLSMANEEELSERLMLGTVYETAGLGRCWYYPNGAPVYNEAELISSTQLTDIPYRLGTDVRAMQVAFAEGWSLPNWYRKEVQMTRELVRDVVNGLNEFNFGRRLIEDLMGESVVCDVEVFLQGVVESVDRIHLKQEVCFDESFFNTMFRKKMSDFRLRRIER